jgi:(p)ppGpp synthase/HD superfamily hydrolase
MRGEDQARIAGALAYALAAHGPQTRKKTDVPYASHLLQVAGLVQENGGDVEQVMAAFLHDTIEDCAQVTEQELASRFGPRVARIVRDCTDTLPGDDPARKRPWKERKAHYLAHLPEAPADSLLVSVCDKLQNVGSIVADLRAHGPVYLERFSAPPPELLWYYRGILAASWGRVPPRLELALDRAVADLEALIG